MKSSLCLIKKQTASFRIVGLMLTITPLGLMLAAANTSAQTSNEVSSSTTTASPPSEPVLGVGNVGNLKLKWKAAGVSQSFGTGRALPVVANGIVYWAIEDNPVTALNASTGATLWEFATKSGETLGSDGSPVSVANGVAYFGARHFDLTDDEVYGANASTGATLWNFTPGAAAVPTFNVVSGGVVYVGTGSSSFTGPGTVDALNAKTGAKLWSFAVEELPVSSAVANGLVYVGTRSPLNGPFSVPGTVDALNANTGVKLWSFATAGTVASSPTVANGVVYLASSDGTLYALNASTGAKLWATGDSEGSSLAVANGVVYISSPDGTVDALNASTSTKLWSFATGTLQQRRPCMRWQMAWFM